MPEENRKARAIPSNVPGRKQDRRNENKGAGRERGEDGHGGMKIGPTRQVRSNCRPVRSEFRWGANSLGCRVALQPRRKTVASTSQRTNSRRCPPCATDRRVRSRFSRSHPPTATEHHSWFLPYEVRRARDSWSRENHPTETVSRVDRARRTPIALRLEGTTKTCHRATGGDWPTGCKQRRRTTRQGQRADVPCRFVAAIGHRASRIESGGCADRRPSLRTTRTRSQCRDLAVRRQPS